MSISAVESRSVPAQLVLSSPAGRWLIVATVLGSSMAFLDCTAVPVALPSIVRDLGGGISAQQWVLNGYLLTLSALLLLGGALGDRYGRRRVFVVGLVAFSAASVACGVAPSGEVLVVARLAQGIGGALLVPGSLALINSSMRSEDRGRAVGMWAGMSGVSTAVGPLLGGWLVDAVSWRSVFLINLPLAAVAVLVALRNVPERHAERRRGPLDIAGAASVVMGLAGVTYVLIEAPIQGWTTWTVLALVAGIGCLMTFLMLELRVRTPLLPLRLFRSAQFTGANVCTFALEGAVAGAFFLVAVQLQQSLGYSALTAGLALVPITTTMVLLSPRAGALAQRIGPRLPMTVGPLLCAAGLVLLARVEPGVTYWAVVFPAVLVFGLGLTTTVAPLTSAVLAAVDERHLGAASGVNNAVAWLAGLIAIAVLPSAAGIDASDGGGLGPGFATAMLIAAAVCALGGLAAFVSIRRTVRIKPQTVPAAAQVIQRT